MLISIGQRKKEPGDLVDSLLECHERIRRFIALARAAGEHAGAPDAEVVEVCAQVERYFTEALPLHVRDEEESVLPRLRGQAGGLDEALAAMAEQHAGHEPLLAALLDASRALRESPRDPSRRAALVTVARQLEQDFTEHLALEEAVVFPAIRGVLTLETQAEILDELRARRRIV